MENGVLPPGKLSMLHAWFEDVLRVERESFVHQMGERHEEVLLRLQAILARLEVSDAGDHDKGGSRDAAARVPRPATFIDGVSRRSGPAAAAAAVSAATEAAASVNESSSRRRTSAMPAQLPGAGDARTSSAGSMGLGEVSPARASAGMKSVEQQVAVQAFAGLDRFKDPRHRPHSFRELVTHPLFEMFFLALIVMSAAEAAAEVQFKGWDTGYILGHPRQTWPAKDIWPWGEAMFEIVGVSFGFLFLSEMLLKMIGLRCAFFKSLYNVYDAVLILIWLVEFTGLYKLHISTMFLRLVRLARVLRLLKLVQYMKGLHHLHLIYAAIDASKSILAWSSMMLTAIMVIWALTLNLVLQGFIEDDTVPEETRLEVFRYFGTFSRSMLTMFEVTLGNFMPPCQTMVDNVSEWFALVFVLYKLIVGFAVIRVIGGVFLHETFSVAASEDELMIMQKERLKVRHAKKMKFLFAEADTTHDGTVGWKEFRSIVEAPRVRTWLSAMELDVRDTRMFFDMLDDGDHEIALDELIAGVAKLKGNARSIDLMAMARETRLLHKESAKSKEVAEARGAVERLERRVIELLAQLELGGGFVAVPQFNGSLAPDLVPVMLEHTRSHINGHTSDNAKQLTRWDLAMGGSARASPGSRSHSRSPPPSTAAAPSRDRSPPPASGQQQRPPRDRRAAENSRSPQPSPWELTGDSRSPPPSQRELTGDLRFRPPPACNVNV